MIKQAPISKADYEDEDAEEVSFVSRMFIYYIHIFCAPFQFLFQLIYIALYICSILCICFM